ncbi:histidine phosphatase family protein [Acidovorax carolinensis]|uniref:Histidine phosphatase family protein n=1 Tax=Acidovorax carolinensis TaxID=553814 RepID=A0A240U078_9BURK|nr:histidine phosphatase family protein [Acidovorax carolinensis]ART51246.1 histidine phosphatase family protein [Acidovorax carolinensis]
MPSSRRTEALVTRRALLGTGAAGALGGGLALMALQAWAAQDADAETLLRHGGVVAVFRHALAPGTFDPPGFRLGDCSTQRNLNDEGRAQARRIGEWFQQRQLQPHKVLSSPWCRCIDSASLAFGAPQVWAALGSPLGYPETTGAAHLRELRQALAAASARSGQFEVWFTHMFVQSDLASDSTRSGEALIVRAHRNAGPQVLAKLSIAV